MAEEQKASLAFSFQKKRVVQKVAVNFEERRDTGQLITGFDGAKAQVVDGEAQKAKTFIVPKLENTFKTGVGVKKFTPTFKPPSNDVVKVKEGEDKFVQAASTVPVITGYGLQVRDVSAEERARAAEANGVGAAGNAAGGGTTAAALEERAYRDAIEELPDVADEEAYEAMPIEEFGRAMLRGMGWEDGMGVGRNRKKVDAIEYVRRPERLGLGAQPVQLAPDTSKPAKMGDKPRRQDLVLAPDADGRQRNVRSLDEKLVARAQVQPGPRPGKAMRITAGPHAGLLCTASEALPGAEGRPERWRVRLAVNDEYVEVAAAELGEKWDTPGAGKEAGRGNGAEEAAGGSGRDRNRESERERERGRGEEAGGGGSREVDEAGPSRRDDRSGRDKDRERERGAQERDAGDDKSRRRDKDRDKDRDREQDRDRERDGGKQKRKHKHKDRDRDEDRSKKSRREDHDREREKEKGRRKESSKQRDRERDRRKSAGSDGSSDEEGSGQEAAPAGPTWLFPQIKVRIVDKAVRGGRLYLKKAVVVDVHPGATADVAVDDTGDVLRLPQSALETVVPKHEGAPVLVVAGPHAGARGRLLQASAAAGAAAVQLAADFSIARLALDDVAQYCGEMEEE